jgi:hypothetical protein
MGVKSLKCLMFHDSIDTSAVDDYNTWAKNKVLAKDVIVHSHQIWSEKNDTRWTTILVFFDERMHPDWVSKDDTET